MLQEIQEIAFELAAREKAVVYRVFLVVYAAILTVLMLGVLAIIQTLPSSAKFYEIGVWSGRAAVTMLAIVLIPGILGRFSIQIKVTRVITFYRRQLGITTFLLAFTHGMLVRIVARLTLGWYPIARAPLFEFFGTIALPFLFLLFATSNNTSVRYMGKWWKRFHRLVYIIVLFLLLHTALQRVSVWSIMIGFVTIAEAASFLYTLPKNRRSI